MPKDKIQKPNFFIVGASKCGTTSLYNWLRQHPDVFMPDEKEPKYFCHDLRSDAQENGSEHLFPIKSQDEYLDLFADAKDEKAIGEASTYYLYSDVAARAIKEFNPDAKIIIMIRDPVEQIISSYNYSVSKGHESARSLEQALELESERKNNPPPGKMPRSFLYTYKATFSKHIQKYQKHFSSKQMKILLLDDLKDNPKDTYQEALDFLEVKQTDFTPKFEKENAGGSPRFRWLNQAIKSPHSPIRKTAKLIPQSWAKRIRNVLNRFLLSKEKSEVSEKTRKKLKQQFKSEVEKLGKITGKDLAALWDYEKLT